MTIPLWGSWISKAFPPVTYSTIIAPIWSNLSLILTKYLMLVCENSSSSWLWYGQKSVPINADIHNKLLNCFLTPPRMNKLCAFNFSSFNTMFIVCWIRQKTSRSSRSILWGDETKTENVKKQYKTIMRKIFGCRIGSASWIVEAILCAFSHFKCFHLLLWLSSEHSLIYSNHSLAAELKNSEDTDLMSSEYVWMITSMFWWLVICLCTPDLHLFLSYHHSTASWQCGSWNKCWNHAGLGLELCYLCNI